MKQKRILAILLLLCLCVNLFACGIQPDAPTDPSLPSDATTATDSDPVPGPWQDYQAAKKAMGLLRDYTVHFDYKLTYTVENQVYRESSIGTVAYAGHGASEKVFVQENLHLGSYETVYYRSYFNGMGYCRVENCNFSSEITMAEFLSQVIPSILLNEGNYNTINSEITENGTRYRFEDAIRMENWTNFGASQTLTKAYGTAELSSDNQLMASDYHAEYLYGGIAYTLDVAVTIDRQTPPDFSMQPVYPEECATLNDLQIPRMLIQAVAAIFDTTNMTATYMDTCFSEAFSVIRSQSGSCDIYGSGNNLSALVANSLSVTNYTGTAVTNTQTIQFSDGIYSDTSHSGETITVDTVTPEDMRIKCEDIILSALYTLPAIQSAEITLTDDFIYIKFTGNSQFADSLCAGIYDVFSLNLDSYSNYQYSTVENSGYLALNRYTKQPTAAGLSLERIHDINGVSCRLTYQLDQSIQLPSATAYNTITGTTPEEPAPTEPVKPLFYKVTGTDGQTLYLLGTVHVGDNRTSFLPEQIMTALQSADALAVEFDSFAFNDALHTDAALQQAFSDAYYYSNHGTYADHLDSESANMLDLMIKASGQNNINAPYTRVAIWCSKLKNYYLSLGSDLTSDKDMDSRLLQWAKAQNKPIYEVESGIAQLQTMTGFSDQWQQMQLQSLLEQGLTNYCADTETLYALWCSGDEEGLTAYLSTDTSAMTEEELALWKDYYKAMYTNRNKAMTKIAKQYLQSGETVFMAVEIAHVLGNGGILHRLQDAGYTIELISYE